MNTINERIAACIKASGLTKTAFAKRINLSQPHISKIALGDSSPSERTILDICREFNVNENWLRTGEGEMFLQLTRDEQIAGFMGGVLRGEPDFRRRLISVLARLSVEEWAVLENMAQKLLEEEQEGKEKGRSDKSDQACEI